MRCVREQRLFSNQLQCTSKVPSRQLRDGAATPNASPAWSSALEAGTFPGRAGRCHRSDARQAPACVIYVASGLARMRWGDRLEFVAEAAAGDFIYVPPYVPHQEINASEAARLHCVLARSGQQGLVVNLDITPVEVPELVRWIDDLHK